LRVPFSWGLREMLLCVWVRLWTKGLHTALPATSLQKAGSSSGRSGQ